MLGHTDKSNVHKQKTLLSGGGMTAVADAGAGDGAAADEKPFSSFSWRARKAVEKARNALLCIDEQRRLLQHSGLTQEQRASVHATLGTHLGALQRALGFDAETNALDSALLGAVVDLGKGRKLLARVLKLLPQQALSMLPTILRHIFAKQPVRSADMAGVDEEGRREMSAVKESEEALLETLSMIVGSVDNPPTYNTLQLCVQNIMTPHLRGSTLNTALSTKTRAELVNVIITRATELAGPESSAQWTTLRGAFLHLAKLQPTPAPSPP